MIEQTITWLVEFVHSLGYLGLFVATFLESTFVPLPSEVTMVPAGYLVQQGIWNLWITLFLAISGTILGSMTNYYIAYYLGRRFFLKFGKYIHFNEHRMSQLDNYFVSHGEISIFTARLIPGVRHVISFPAGLAKMHLKKFVLLTGLGGGLWMTVLLFLGYTIGGNKALVKQYVPYIALSAITLVCVLVAVYVARHRRKVAKGV